MGTTRRAKMRHKAIRPLTAGAVLLVCASGGIAQTRDPVGSIGPTVGAVVPGVRTTPPRTTIGSKVTDEAPALVQLLDNEGNPCFDGDANCRLYWMAPNQSDPDIVYDGRVMVQSPTFMNVVILREDDPDLYGCLMADRRPVHWSETVERGRTVADPGATNLSVLFSWAQGGDTSATRYRIVWCPSSTPESPLADPKPRGRSWRLRVLPRSATPGTTR